MYSFIILLLYLLCANGLLVFISKKSFGKCLPLLLMINTFIYFISQILFKTFKIGFIINVLEAILFVVLILWSIYKKKDIKNFKANYFSRGFYSFIVIYIAVFIYNLNSSLVVWDELSHWGEMVKEMFRLDRFYTVKESVLIVHKDYPPIMPLLELFFCHLQGGFKEVYLLRAVHLFNLSLFLPALEFKFEFNKLKTIFKTLLTIACVGLIILLFDQQAGGLIGTIYVDYPLALLTAYLLSLIIFEDNQFSIFYIINLSIGCCFLIMTKQICLTLYAMVIFFFAINLLLKNINKLRNLFKNKTGFIFITFILLIIIPLLMWKGWSSYVDNMGVYQQFKISDLKIQELLGVVKQTSGEIYQQAAARNFISAILRNGLMTSNVISLTYFQCIIIVFLLLYLIWLYGKNILDKKEIILSGITLGIGSVGYLFVMLVLYVFSFGPVEGPNLASFYRYIPTYIIVCLSFILQLYIFINSKKEMEKEPKNNELKNLILVTTILILLQSPVYLLKLAPRVIKNHVNDVYINHANSISNKTDENSKIYIIAQNSDGAYQFYTSYYMSPRVVNVKFYNLPKDLENYEEYFYSEVNNYMLEYDYLYLAVIDEDFENNYNFLFNNEKIEKGQLYKIENENGKVKLSMEE